MTNAANDKLKAGYANTQTGALTTETSRTDTTFNTIVALRVPIIINTGETIEALRRIESGKQLTIATHGPDDGELLMVNIDGIEVTILNIPHPAPIGTFDRAAHPNFFWPTAQNDLKAHSAHVFIVARDNSVDARDVPMKCARVLTALTAAIASITPTIGVYWPASENLVDKAFYLRAVRESNREDRQPLEVWIRLYVSVAAAHQGNAEQITVATRGLRRYAGRDLEMSSAEESIDTLLVQIFQIANYLTEGVSRFADGDTLGGGERTERLVHLSDQGILGDGPVYQVITNSTTRDR